MNKMNKEQIAFTSECINAMWDVYKKYVLLSPHLFDEKVFLFDFFASVATTIFIRIMNHALENIVKPEDLIEKNIKVILSEVFKEMEGVIIGEVCKEKKSD
jgi:hypothetical protein